MLGAHFPLGTSHGAHVPDRIHLIDDLQADERLQHVLHGDHPIEAAVFVYDPASGTLSERRVTVANVLNNSMEIVGDLSEGEIIATAGVSFLHDGMTVTLFDPATLR